MICSETASDTQPSMAMKPVARLDYQASIERPRLALPDGKRVAVHVGVNVENWDIGRPMPRQVVNRAAGRVGDPRSAEMGLA